MHQKSLKILFSTYWSRNGWVRDDERVTAPDDLEYAKNAGVMFDDVCVSHDDLVKRANDIVGHVGRRQVADAFLASLSTRRLDWRSAIASWCYLSCLPDHSSTSPKTRCDVCGWHNDPKRANDLNVLNFERHKWGGVRRDDLLFAVFDIERFADTSVTSPTSDDRDLFLQIVSAIKGVPPETTPTKLQAHLPKSLKSNKDERDVVLDILGICGILQSGEHRGYYESFTSSCDRELPPHRFIDRAYPFCWWRGSDGINVDALKQFFGDLF